MEKLRFIKLNLPWQYDPYSDPPLGTLSVAAKARAEGKVEVSLTDLAHETEIPDSDFYAFSASTLEYPEAEKEAKKLKERLPESIILAGGPHFDIISEDDWKANLQNTPFDIVCRGEGETTIGRAIEFAKNHPGEKTVITQNVPLQDINNLDLPARDLLDQEKYFKPGKTFGSDKFTEGNSSTIMVSRGCPYVCSFCASPQLHKRKVRFRNYEKITEELNILKNQYGVSELRWQDDCISLVLNKTKGLESFLNETEIKSRGSLRTDQVNPDMLDKLWYAGFRELGFGIESAENNILDLLNKKTNVEKNLYALHQVKKRGFRARAFIMTGLPGESANSADKMINFLEKSQPDVVTLTSFIPLPGCDIYNNPDKYGVKINTRDWSKYDIAIKWNSGTEWAHEISSASINEMETNREKLKEYLFNHDKSNVSVYNKPYKAQIKK